MNDRLNGFDYTRPFYYMVTLKRRDGLAPFSAIVAPGRSQLNDVTKAFVHVIRGYHGCAPALAPITCFSIMPDHIHLLIRLIPYKGPTMQRSLPALVEGLMSALSRAYWQVMQRHGLPYLATAPGTSIFEAGWHDWIVKKQNQLATFTRYVRENPLRHWIRHENRAYFQRVNAVSFLGQTWYGYGNPHLLELPQLEPLRYSRKISPASATWCAAVAAASRLGPGCAGVGTFMSPLEKACGHALGLAGGRWVVLSPEGFGARWHPCRRHERFCAEGRMLFLSLWPAQARQPTRAELYERCHHMGDLVVAGLGREKEKKK